MHTSQPRGPHSLGFETWNPAAGPSRCRRPILWGVLAAWIPIPPSVMAGLLIAAMVYALLNYLFGLREWAVDNEEPIYA